MKGAVVIGDVFEGTGVLTVQELSVLGIFGVAIISPVAFGAFLWLKDRWDHRDARKNEISIESQTGTDYGRVG